MKNTIFLMTMACLLAGCAGKGPTVMKLKTEAEVTSKQGLPVKVESGRSPLLIKVADKPALLFSAIAALATIGAAFAAWWAAYNTRKAAEGRLFLEQINNYSSSREMRDAVKLLWDWSGIKHRADLKKRQTKKELRRKADDWIKKLNDGEDEANKIDIARRMVKFYYMAVLRLYESGYSSKRLFEEFCETADPLILRIILPLEEVLSKNIGKKAGQEYFLKMVKKFEPYMNE